METNPQTSNSQISAPVSLAARALALSTVVLVVLAGVVAAAYWAFLSPDAAFRGLRVVSGPYESRTLTEIGWFGRVSDVELQVPGRVTDYARAGSTEAAVVVLPDATQSIHLLRDGEVVSVLAQGQVTSALALSEDGTLLAYSKRTAASTAAEAADFYARDSWEVMIVDTATGSERLAGVGYGPSFFLKDGKHHLAFLTPASLHIVEIESNTHQDIAVGLESDSGYRRVSISSAGEQALIPSGPVYKLFDLSYADGLFGLSYVSSTPDPATLAVFRGDTIVTALTGTTAATLTVWTLGEILEMSQKDFPAGIVYNVIP